MKTYQKLNPSAARICINYDDTKNFVTFNYPSKKSAFKVCKDVFINFFSSIYITTILIIILVINVILIQKYFVFAYILVAIIGIYLAAPILCALIFSKTKLLKYMPDFSYFIATHFMEYGYNYIEIRKLNNKRFEIPLFENIFLDYEMIGDFKKYIKKINIIEYNFNYKSKKFFFKTVKIKQDHYWKCIFDFNKIPKKGYLKIKFL